MAAKYVAPYRMKGQNDLNDAVAICEAVQRPSTRFVPIKSPEQQAVIATHSIRVHTLIGKINEAFDYIDGECLAFSVFMCQIFYGYLSLIIIKRN